MKSIFTYLTGLFMLSLALCCNINSESAAKYNDIIELEHEKVLQKEDSLIRLFENIENNNTVNFNNALNALSKQIELSLSTVNNLEAFNGNSEYKNAAKDLFTAYKKATDIEYPEIIKIYNTPDELYTPDLDSQLMKKTKELDDRLNKSNDAFVIIQHKFAQKYNLAITSKAE